MCDLVDICGEEGGWVRSFWSSIETSLTWGGTDASTSEQKAERFKEELRKKKQDYDRCEAKQCFENIAPDLRSLSFIWRIFLEILMLTFNFLGEVNIESARRAGGGSSGGQCWQTVRKIVSSCFRRSWTLIELLGVLSANHFQGFILVIVEHTFLGTNTVTAQENSAKKKYNSILNQ